VPQFDLAAKALVAVIRTVHGSREAHPAGGSARSATVGAPRTGRPFTLPEASRALCGLLRASD
jgi:hypothetical protein